MTRRAILVLFTFFSSFVVASIASPVSADSSCRLSAQEQCVQVSAPPAQTTEARAIYRVSNAYLYVPRPGGMWAVMYTDLDGRMITEDFVSGPLPVNGVAISPPEDGITIAAPMPETASCAAPSGLCETFGA